MNELLFTPASLLDLLRQLDELSEYNISVEEIPGSAIQINIGESTYSIDTKSATDVVVDKEVVEDVADVNSDTYSELSEGDVDVEFGEVVESGLIKEVAKTLLVGGLVRLTNKLLSKDRKNTRGDERG